MDSSSVVIRIVLAAFFVLTSILPTGCRRSSSGEADSIKLATTTSTENSGLLDVLLPAFFLETGIDVQVLPMGSGKAIRTARDGNCDVVLVHSPKAEERFVSEGWGVDRRAVMYNDFVIIGPAADPAGVRGEQSAAKAFEKIAAMKCVFVSRGDNSGTNAKEMALWRSAGIEPAGSWYRSVGKGMGETLTMAGQMGAYTLADRGTFITFREKIGLVVLAEGDMALHNPYSVIAVNPKKHPRVNYAGAMKFIEFLTSDQGRKLIGDYKMHGETLFHPRPGPSE